MKALTSGVILALLLIFAPPASAQNACTLVCWMYGSCDYTCDLCVGDPGLWYDGACWGDLTQGTCGDIGVCGQSYPSNDINPAPIPEYGHDDDEDGIDDHTEYDIAWALLPTIWLQWSDYCPEPYEPKPIMFRARHLSTDWCGVPQDWVMVTYVVLYEEDCGWGGHEGDAEGFGVLGQWNGSNWIPYATTATAHYGTWSENQSLFYNLGSRGEIWASNNKHGNFVSVDDCNGFSWAFDTCLAYGWEPTVRLFNIGEPDHHLVNALSVVSDAWWLWSVWSGPFMETTNISTHTRILEYWMPAAPGCGYWHEST